MRVTKYYEWLFRDGNCIKVGLTKEACAELNEIVFIQLPEIGLKVENGQFIALLETNKSAIELFSPLSGVIKEVNRGLVEDISPLNIGDLKERWLYLIEPNSFELFNNFPKYLTSDL